MSNFIAKLARFSNYVVTELKGNCATVRIPAPSFDDVNRAGNIGIWRVIHWLGRAADTAATLAEDQEAGFPFLEKAESFSNNSFSIVATISATVDEAFYGLLKTDFLPSLTAKVFLRSIGNSSWCETYVLSDEISGKLLARQDVQLVGIDRTTRKSVPLPDWWKRKYASFVTENQRLDVHKLLPPANGTYEFPVKASWNDIDENGHVNYMSYVLLCLDGAMDAMKHNFYVGFHGDILNYNVKAIRISYMKEAEAGDCLVVVTWQDSCNPRTLNFSIERNRDILVQCSLEFFFLLRSSL